jgi:hypothetical protein
MTNFILSVCLCLFLSSTYAQVPNKNKVRHTPTRKCPVSWDSCNAKGLFSTQKIYYNPKHTKEYCNISWGMSINNSAHQNLSNNKTKHSKSIIQFSFGNFESCLYFLTYKKFKLTPINKAFKKLKSTYQNPKNEMLVSEKNYHIFLKKYWGYINTLPNLKKQILKEYISFFENQYNVGYLNN